MQYLEELRKLWQAAITHFSNLKHWLVGTDPALLAQCTKGVQTFYAALAVLMMTAATLAATNLAPQLAAMWGMGAFGTVLAWCGTWCFVLCLEAAIVNTINGKAAVAWVLLPRLLVALFLGLIQGVPHMVKSFEPAIALERHAQGVSFQLNDHAANRKLLSVDDFTQQAKLADEQKAQAQTNLSNPPPDAAVTTASKLLAAKQKAEVAARSKFSALQQKVATLQAQLRKAASEDKGRLSAAVTTAQTELEQQRSLVSAAELASRSAQTALQRAQDEQKGRLEEAFADASQLAQSQNKKLASASTELTARDQQASTLTQAAARPDFFLQLNTLLELANKNPNVKGQMIVTYLGYLLLDLMAVLLKVMARSNEYSQRLEAQMEIEHYARTNAVAQARADMHMQTAHRAQQQALMENQTLGIKRWVAENAGDLELKLAELDAQLKVQEANVLQGIAVTEAALTRLAELLEHLVRNQQTVEAHPEVAEVYAQQLHCLVNEIQARVDRLHGGFAGATAS